jgi:hypothetical protein
MHINKNTITNILIGLLVIVNIITLSLYWLKIERPEPLPKNNGRAEDFVIRELKLDSAQQIAYLAMVKEHRQQVQDIRRSFKNGKEQFFDLLKNDTVNTNEFNEALKGTTVEQMKVDSITFYHFKKLRAICNPAQKKKFDEIIQQVLRMSGGPRPISLNGRPENQPQQEGKDRMPPPPGGQDFQPDGHRPPPPDGREHDGPPPPPRDGPPHSREQQ